MKCRLCDKEAKAPAVCCSACLKKPCSMGCRRKGRYLRGEDRRLFCKKCYETGNYPPLEGR